MKSVILIALAAASALTTPAAARGGGSPLAVGQPLWISSPVFRNAKPRAGERTSYTDEAVVQTIRVQAATRSVRLRLTNELGDAPIAIGAVSIAAIGADGTPGPAVPVRFSMRETLDIAPGGVAVSDSVVLPLRAFADLAVTVRYVGAAPVVAHRAVLRLASGGAPVSGPGIVSAVESDARGCGRVVVALGDSITEGAGSTKYNDYPSVLARRLSRGSCPATVVNAGIGGNAVLKSGGSPGLLARFDRDVLALPGVTDILLSEGVNDIRGWESPSAARRGTAADLIAGYRQIVARAHAHGIRVIGGTLVPYKGTGNQTDYGLTVLDEVNAQIRAGGVFDGYVEFNHAVADPADPQRMRADMHKGDWLHPNDTGYAAMAAAVPVALFSAPRR